MDKILRPGLFLLLFVLVGVYAFVFGESGIFERRRLEEGKQHLAEQLRSLQAENALLKETLERYRRGDYPPDLMNRKGYLAAGEKAVRVAGASVNVVTAEKPAGTENGESLFHLRVAWVVLSIFAIMVYLWHSMKKEDRGES